MDDQELVFSRFLQRQGLRLTYPRKQILDAVFSLHVHFNAEELYDHIKASTPGISLATVYRTLPLLLEAGLVQQTVRSCGRERYEHIYGHPQHIHWLCRKCGSIQETDLTSLKSVLKQHAKGLKFELEQVDIGIRGICWKCQANENENQLDER